METWIVFTPKTHTVNCNSHLQVTLESHSVCHDELSGLVSSTSSKYKTREWFFDFKSFIYPFTIFIRVILSVNIQHMASRWQCGKEFKSVERQLKKTSCYKVGGAKCWKVVLDWSDVIFIVTWWRENGKKTKIYTFFFALHHMTRNRKYNFNK